MPNELKKKYCMKFNISKTILYFILFLIFLLMFQRCFFFWCNRKISSIRVIKYKAMEKFQEKIS